MGKVSVNLATINLFLDHPLHVDHLRHNRSPDRRMHFIALIQWDHMVQARGQMSHHFQLALWITGGLDYSLFNAPLTLIFLKCAMSLASTNSHPRALGATMPHDRRMFAEDAKLMVLRFVPGIVAIITVLITLFVLGIQYFCMINYEPLYPGEELLETDVLRRRNANKSFPTSRCSHTPITPPVIGLRFHGGDPLTDIVRQQLGLHQLPNLALDHILRKDEPLRRISVFVLMIEFARLHSDSFDVDHRLGSVDEVYRKIIELSRRRSWMVVEVHLAEILVQVEAIQKSFPPLVAGVIPFSLWIQFLHVPHIERVTWLVSIGPTIKTPLHVIMHLDHGRVGIFQIGHHMLKWSDRLLGLLECTLRESKRCSGPRRCSFG